MNVDEENPQVRIANALEKIAIMVEKFANPPLLASPLRQDFISPYLKDSPSHTNKNYDVT